MAGQLDGAETMRGLLIVVMALLLSGCASAPQRDRNMLIGAGFGAAAGALIGSAAGGPPAAWAGAAIGAVSGGVIGSLVKDHGCYIRNKRGELWQVPCDGPRVRAEACFVSGGLADMTQVDCTHRVYVR
jgi:hypothetical protein